MLTFEELRKLRDEKVFGELRKREKAAQKQEKASDAMPEFEMSVAPKEKKVSKKKTE